ncbi:hypothetical protein BFL38_10515 [Brachyspira hampsonii]|uniref:Uncharacterized protein n=1 Tax=Brachyspira hampsonii TaxID=1287055 RepID=A0A1E5NIC9_9SPIR|nr:hypothetical protein [Brachyspira hampsonii]OEJ15884.1 hypothetical protein BFL38_10515 [Brachyspira hampsonii]
MNAEVIISIISLSISVITLIGTIIYNHIVTSKFPSKRLSHQYLNIILKEFDEIEKYIFKIVYDINILKDDNFYFETFISAKNKNIRELLTLFDKENRRELNHETFFDNMNSYENLSIKIKIYNNNIKYDLREFINKLLSCKRYIYTLIYKEKIKS